jgi:8-oxo-dGTP diphosphatase
LVRDAGVPVYALGGMRREDVARARLAGGQGIAGISFGWR